MVSVNTVVNKLTATVNSTCKIFISKLITLTDELATPNTADSELATPKTADSELITPKTADSELITPKTADNELATPTNADSDYLLKEGEVSIDLEQVHSTLDLEFRRLLLQTKLGDVGSFKSGGVSVEFTLLEITRAPSIHLISDTDKLARAIQHKERGCDLFRQNKREAAFERFRASVRYLIFLKDKTMPEADDTYATVCNNMAMCQMKVGNYGYAIDLCDKVLTVDETNEKALYRRAFCYTELKQYEKAHADLMMLAHSKDTSVKKLMEVVQEHRKQQHEEYKIVVKNMFR